MAFARHRDDSRACSGAFECGGQPFGLGPAVRASLDRQDEPARDIGRLCMAGRRKRGLPFPFFEVFDLPDQTLTCGRRNVSTVATQALTLLNNDFVLSHSRRFADRIRKMSATDKSEQLNLAYQLSLGRQPDARERELGLEFLDKNTLEDLTHVLFNLSEFLYLR